MDHPKKITTSGSKDTAVQEVTPSASILEAKAQHRKRMIFLIALGVIVLGVTGFFTYKYFSPKKEPAPDVGYQENIEQIIDTRPPDDAPIEERAGYYATLGAAYSSAEQTDKAIEALKKAESLYTQDADKYGVWYNLGQSYESKGMKRQAVTYYRKALHFVENPPSGEPRDNDLIRTLNDQIKKLGG